MLGKTLSSNPLKKGRSNGCGRKDVFFFFISLFFKDQELRHSWLVGRSWENSFFLNLLKKEESNGVIVKPASVLAVILFLEGLGGLTFLGGLGEETCLLNGLSKRRRCWCDCETGFDLAVILFFGRLGA